MSFVASFCGRIVLKNRIKSQTFATKIRASSLFMFWLKLEPQQRMYIFCSSLKCFLGHLQFVCDETEHYIQLQFEGTK